MKKTLSFLIILALSITTYTQNLILNDDFTISIEIDPQQELQQLIRNNMNITLALDAGSVYNLYLKETKILSENLAREISDIRTFNAFNEGQFVGTYTWSPHGVWYYLTIYDKQIAVYPDLQHQNNTHFIEYGAKKIEGVVCGLDKTFSDAQRPVQSYTPNQMRDITSSFGQDLRDYRLYITTTGEFYQLNGAAPGLVDAIITATINGLNAIYQNELSLKFTLVDRRLHTNPDTDPFIPDNGMGETRPSQAGTVINGLYGAARYDIGHVLHKSSANDGWGSGGIAQLNSVCNDNVNNGAIAKASGWSGSFNNSGFGWLGLISHEIGHQFGAQHTFNGSGGSCDDAISDNTAYEIGSGTTIMSYNGICDADQNIPASGAADNYFHVNSLMQMMAHIMGVGDCAAKVASNNNLPVVSLNTCNANLVVPKNTPFYIDAEATDEDGDPLTYCWEQFDEDGPGTPSQGAIGISAAILADAPLFRSYPPTPESFRYFPDRQTVLNGNNSDPFDVLPALARSVLLKLTVRDNNINGGGTTIEDLPITVSGQGPLIVQNQGNWDTGDDVAITWTVGGSGDLCDVADIYLSIDGGQSYPYLIGDDVDYASGTMNFNVSGLYPNTTNARLKIECDDYECFTFYDVSNNTFRINSICDAPQSFLCPAVDQMFDSGDPGLNMTGLTNIVGDKVTVIQKSVSFSSPTMDVVTFDIDGTTCKKVSDDYVAEFATIQVDKPGDYIFEIDPNFEGYGFVSIFTESNFSTTNACPSFVSSSGVWSGNGSSVSARRSMTATLDPCVTYRIAFFNYDPTNRTRIDNITGPGSAIIEETTPNPDYSFVYIAVNNENDLIAFVDQNPDFSSLPGGSYTIHGITYKSGGTTPPNITDFNNYLNQTFNSFYIDGDCFLSSNNSFQLDIEGSCSITGATVGTTGSCSPADNMFTQEVTLTFDMSPASGDLIVNGQTFAIAGSPQTVLISLPSNGELFTGEAYFSAEPNCKVTFEVQQPDNCCTFDVNLGGTIDICSGDTYTLDAGIGGVGGGSYQWFDGAGNDLMVSTSTLDVMTAGDYIVLVTSSTGCPKRDTATIQVNDVPTLTVSDDVTICDGEFITLTATTNGTTVRWTSEDTIIQEGPGKTLVVNTGGVYLVESYFAEACKISEMITVTANVSPDPDLGEDVFLCEGETATLDGTADGNEYVWYLDGDVQPESGPMFMVDVTSTITVEVTNDGGCTGTDEVDVLVEGVPTLAVSDDVTICDGEATTLTANTTASLIKWFIDGELFQSGPDNTYQIMTGGTVVVQAGNSENCALVDSIIVTANASPRPRLGFNVEECEGETVRLATNTDGETYVWYQDGAVIPMEMDSFIFVDQTATYRLEVTNIGGCTGTDEVDVEFFAAATADAGGDVTFCEGEVANVVASASSLIFFWTKDGVPYPEDDLAFTTNEPGQYVLEVQNEASCSTYDTIQIASIAAPPVDFGDDKNACIGDVVDLEGPIDPDYTYQWFENGNPISMAQSIAVSSNGVYLLVVTDNNGCSNEDGVEVIFSPGPTLAINETDVMLCESEVFTAEVVTNANDVQWFKDGAIIPGATNFTLDIDESGTYTAQAEGMSGCIVTETVEVQINPLPLVMLEDELIACEGEMVTLESNTMAESYSWLLNNMEVSDEASFDTDQPGIYTLVVTNEFNCDAQDMIEVSFVALPTIDLDNTAEFCEGASIVLTAVSNGNAFQWLLNGNAIVGATSLTYEATAAGTYTFEATGQGSCANTQDVQVTAVTAPIVDLGADITLCPGESITLDAGPNSGSIFEWSSGDNTRTIDLMNDNVPAQTTETISVNVTNSADCSTSDMIIVTYLPILEVVVTSENDGVCTGDSLLLTASGGAEYNWSGPPGTFINVGQNAILVFPDTPTDYTVDASDQCPNNMDSETIAVNVYTPEPVSAGNDTCVLIGRTIELNAFGGFGYQWQADPTLLSGGSTATPRVMPEVETTYTVTITDSNGCRMVDDVTVCIITDPLSIFKPVTAITPNGDGFNDELEFPGLEAFAENTLIIYNRWGNVIYEKEGYQQDGFLFDGLRNGEELPADTYYYILKFDEFVIKETLTIIRPN